MYNVYNIAVIGWLYKQLNEQAIKSTTTNDAENNPKVSGLLKCNNKQNHIWTLLIIKKCFYRLKRSLASSSKSSDNYLSDISNSKKLASLTQLKSSEQINANSVLSIPFSLNGATTNKDNDPSQNNNMLIGSTSTTTNRFGFNFTRSTGFERRYFRAAESS